MGHRHTPKEFGSESAVCSVDGGFVAAAAGHVGAHSRALAAGDEKASDKGESRLCPTKMENLSVSVRMALFALRFYKAYLSMLFAGSCRFEPTCSRYAYEAIERFGLAPGVWLGLKRLLRCHPLSRRFGYDPVPENWKEMRSEMKAANPHEVIS